MKGLLERLQNNKKIKALLFYGIIIFLFLYVFSLPSFSARHTYVLITYFSLGILCFLAILYNYIYLKLHFLKQFYVLIAFVALAFMSTCFLSKQFRNTLTILLLSLSFYLIFYAFIALGKRILIVQIIVLALLAFSLYFFIHYCETIFAHGLWGDRLGFFFDNVNKIGFYFAIGYTLSLYLLFQLKTKKRFIYLIPLIIFLLLGLFTGSRAFFVTIICVSLVAIIFKFRRNKKLLLISIFSLLVVLSLSFVLGLLGFLGLQFENALKTVFGSDDSIADVSTSQRIAWIRFAFYLFGESPVFGWGCDGFSLFSGIGSNSHNNYAEILCNFGILGFALWHFFILYPLINHKKRDNDCLIILVTVLILTRSLFGLVYYAKETYLLIALLYFYNYSPSDSFSNIMHCEDNKDCSNCENDLSVFT